MKKIISKFWGIAVIVVMLSSLFIAAAPVSAATPLTWNYDPSVPHYTAGSSWGLYPGTDIVDFAVSPDGMTVYAALKMTDGSDNAILLKSTNGGAGWTDLTSTTNNRVTENAAIDSIDFVALSPDDPDVVVVLDAGGFDTNIVAAASTDGGNNFYDMGTIQGYGTNAIDNAYDLDVSPVSSNNIYEVAIAGDSGGEGVVYYYNLGATVGQWREAVNDFGNNLAVTPTGGGPADGTVNPWDPAAVDSFNAVKFSPNFASDGVLMALSANTSLDLHVIGIVSHRWDDDFLGNTTATYPVKVQTGITGVNSAAIGLGPDFIGNESESLISFIGAALTGTNGGIYRVDESATVEVIKANTAINSIDYDGNTVVAGAYTDDNVYRVTDPLASSPTASSARSLKKIGVDDGTVPDKVIVHWAGEVIFGAKSGAASALSKSNDLGLTWNDFALMDNSNTYITDVFVMADGSIKYVAGNDGGESFIYRIQGMSAQRVFCVDMTTTHPSLALRGLPDDPDALYAYDTNGTDIYQTSDGGLTRWSKKTTYPGGSIDAMAVETATTIYAASGTLVYKSTNNGSGWGSPVDTLVSNIFSMVSLGEGQLVVGGDGNVGWSTDGGATWAKNGPPVADNGADIMVAATGLTSSDYIFAAPYGGTVVYRANPAPVGTEFKTMNLPAYTSANATATNRAMVLTQGILYVVGSGDGSTAANTGISLYHTMAPTAPSHTATLWGTENIYSAYLTATTPVLGVSTGSIKLYTPQKAPGPPSSTEKGVFYFDDIVSQPSAAPTLIGPADGAQFQIVSSFLADTQLVNFTWQRAASQITAYSLQVALDAGFTQPITSPPQEVSSGSPSSTVSFVVTRGLGWFDPGVTYYWRVMTKTPFSGAWSETRSFTIAPSIATVPELLTPANGASITTVSPAFSWSAITGTTKYDFQISELPGFETTIFTDQTNDAGEALPVTITLEQGKTYFWRVRAAEPVLGDWSTVGNFQVVAKATTTPPVTVTNPPPITITIPTPPAPTTITVSPPPPAAQIAPAYIWAIIIIGAILVIAVIVLIVRTRRSV
jgi:hypothetical protein